MRRQFTATVYILHEFKVLLIFHRKLSKWLPPGGHVDDNELPSDAAIREAREETGLEIELISQENVWINCWNARSFPRPHLCLLEEIPARPHEPKHQHIDMVYVGRLLGGVENHNTTECESMRWFTLDEIEELESDAVIFDETKQVLRGLFALTNAL